MEELKKAALVLTVAILFGFLGYICGYSAGMQNVQVGMVDSYTGSQTAVVRSVTMQPTKRPVTVAPTATPKIYSTLSKGDTGDDVKKLQQRLNLLGYDVGAVDGIFGAKTEAGVKAFQQAAKLNQTGSADTLTQSMLYGANALTLYGSTPKPTPKPTPTPKPVRMVWITRTGECYHSIPNCGSSKYVTEVTLSEAKNAGYRACNNCY